MSDNFKDLFNPNLLASRAEALELELGSAERAIVHRWAQLCADPRFRQETERSTQAQFLVEIFGNLLGFTMAAGNLDAHHILIDLETAVNDRVYSLFALTPAERATLDDHMHHAMIDYSLGEV